MKRTIFVFVMALFMGSLVFSQTNQTRYVAVQNTSLKSSAGFLANDLGTLSLGATVTLIGENGKWSQVKAGNHTGWVASASLSARKVVASGSTAISASEVALAGKGLNQATEIEYRKGGLNYAQVDNMEKNTVSTKDLKQFIESGRLLKGDGNSTDFTAETDDYTMEDAYYLGRTVAANILRYYPVYQNRELTEYVNKICQAIVINSPQPVIFNGYSVLILDSNEFNAFATSGGHIFVTRRLVESITSEDMLAAVVAHELAHIILRHGIAIINETRLNNDLSFVAGRAASIAGDNSEQARQAANLRASLANSIDTWIKNGYSQSQEYEADLEAIVLLSKAGYDPSALLEMLRALQQIQGSQMSGIYSTHPGAEQRIANVDKLNYSSQNTRQYRTARFKAALKK